MRLLAGSVGQLVLDLLGGDGGGGEGGDSRHRQLRSDPTTAADVSVIATGPTEQRRTEGERIV